MCGRYASSRRPEDLIEEFEVVESRVRTPLEADFNVAPTKEVYAVLERPPSRRDGEADRQAEQAEQPEQPVSRGRSVSCGCCGGGWCRRGPRTPPSATG